MQGKRDCRVDSAKDKPVGSPDSRNTYNYSFIALLNAINLPQNVLITNSGLAGKAHSWCGQIWCGFRRLRKEGELCSSQDHIRKGIGLLEGLHCFSFPEDAYALCYQLLAPDGFTHSSTASWNKWCQTHDKWLMQGFSGLAGLPKLTRNGCILPLFFTWLYRGNFLCQYDQCPLHKISKVK